MILCTVDDLVGWKRSILNTYILAANRVGGGKGRTLKFRVIRVDFSRDTAMLLLDLDPNPDRTRERWIRQQQQKYQHHPGAGGKPFHFHLWGFLFLQLFTLCILSLLKLERRALELTQDGEIGDLPWVDDEDDRGAELLGSISHKYYIYNLPEHLILSPHNNDEDFVWSLYKELQVHPLRTFDPNKATFFIPPVFVSFCKQRWQRKILWCHGISDFFGDLSVHTWIQAYLCWPWRVEFQLVDRDRTSHGHKVLWARVDKESLPARLVQKL